MNWQYVSAGVIFAAPVLIGAYDLAAYLISGNDATISRISYQTAVERPGYRAAVCFSFGVLCGHLFVVAPRVAVLPFWVSAGLFVALPVLVAFASLWSGLRIPDVPGAVIAAKYPLMPVLFFLNLGALIGGAFLSQTPQP